MTIDIKTIPTPVTDANPGLAAAILTELRNALRLTAPDPTHLTTSDLDRWLHHEARRLRAQHETDTVAWLTALPVGEAVSLTTPDRRRVIIALKTGTAQSHGTTDAWATTSGALSTDIIATRHPVRLMPTTDTAEGAGA